MELNPKAAGFAPGRLERIAEHLSRNYVDNGKIAGCQVAVTRKGHLAYFKSLGQMDRERGKPMADDTIFRIYSMSKPITTVAVMMLVEQGKITLDEPIAKYIPAFKDMKVGVETRGEDGKPKLELTAAKKPMSSALAFPAITTTASARTSRRFTAPSPQEWPRRQAVQPPAERSGNADGIPPSILQRSRPCRTTTSPVEISWP